MMIKEAIEWVSDNRSLSIDQAGMVMAQIMDGEATESQLGAFLVGLRMKGESSEEIAGMATTMRQKSLRVEIDGTLVDTCGTGGDGSGTFNISTAAAFVAAGSGLKIAKHGNRAASGICGSADVLEALGVKIDLGPDDVKRCIEEVGVGFMFAPIFHPAMRYAASVRKDIGIRTVFNMLGPLTNPALVKKQLLGVSSTSIGNKMADVLRLMGSEHSLVVHGDDGLDEMTLGGSTHVWEIRGSVVDQYSVTPQELGLASVSMDSLKGGTPMDNAHLLRRLMFGEQGPHREIVLLNSAGVLLAGDKVANLKEGIKTAAEVLDGGEALLRMEGLIELSQELGSQG